MGTSLMGRLFKWVQRPLADAAVAVADIGVETPAGPKVNDEQRLAVSDVLWGEGFLWPGGEAEIMRLVAPLGLSAAHSLLFVGCGAGGPARVISGSLGVWVSGFEADGKLAAIATRRLQRCGIPLAKRATIGTWRPEAAAFPARGFHHGVLLDVLDSGDPVTILAAAIQAVKPGGQVIVVQTLAGTRGDALGRTIPQILEAHGCDVRIVEDESARHARLVLQGWRAMLRQIRGERPGAAEAASLVEEAARWLYRLRDIREGRLRVVRWVAIAPRVN